MCPLYAQAKQALSFNRENASKIAACFCQGKVGTFSHFQTPRSKSEAEGETRYLSSATFDEESPARDALCQCQALSIDQEGLRTAKLPPPSQRAT